MKALENDANDTPKSAAAGNCGDFRDETETCHSREVLYPFTFP